MPISRIRPFTRSSPIQLETNRQENCSPAIGWCNIENMLSDQSKDKLERLIQNNEVKAEEVVKLGRDLTQWGQGILDLSGVSRKVIEYSPPPGFDFGRALKAWQSLNDQQDAVIAGLRPLASPLVNSPGLTTAAFEMTVLASPQLLASYQSPDKQDAARADSEQLSYVLDQLADKESVLPLLRQFQLDKAASGKQSPLTLFENAWAAYEKPVTLNSPTNTSLIPMRECINETIAALLRRRPRREAPQNKHDKIISIGSQLASDGVTRKEIESLATRWRPKGPGGLFDELSDSKGNALSREEWRSTLRRATLFLRELLQCLDPAKLR